MHTYTITAIKPHSRPIRHTVSSDALKDKWVKLYHRNRYRIIVTAN